MKSIALSLATALFLSSCTATRTFYVRVPLPIPVMPKLIPIQGAELTCLSGDTFVRLVNRELQHEEYEARLLAILKTTHKKSD